MTTRASFYKKIISIYKPRYILLNAIIAVLYYAVFQFLLHYGIAFAFTNVPLYLMYALVITSSVLFTVAIYSLVHNRKSKRLGALNGGVGTAMPAVGSFIAGCGCHGLALLALFSAVISTSEAISVVDFLQAYQVPLFAMLIVLNLVLIVKNVSSIRVKP
jgi:hypothetical protein